MKINVRTEYISNIRKGVILKKPQLEGGCRMLARIF